MLTPAERDHFIEQGYVQVDGAFPPALAAAGRAILFDVIGCDPDDRATWPGPVARVGDRADPPFRDAVNTPRLTAAYDALVGSGRWQPRGSIGTFPIRFPSDEPPGDDGWHIDASLDFDRPDFLDWRVNVRSDGRALLMLFLFSDVGPDDAPTRLRCGSHADIARLLGLHGEDGMTLRELAALDFATSVPREEALATGEAGTVYLCHPFLVHAAQAHRGTRPRIIAQPPLLPRGRMDISQGNPAPSPVEQAIIAALR